MKKVILILLLVGVVAGIWVWRERQNQPVIVEKNVISDGTVRFSYPNDFGLAVSPGQVLVKSYIPPCDEGFDYCLYYNGHEFDNTNFESAGVRISKRADLTSETTCLNTPPAGYTNMGASTKKYDNYSASIFSPLSDAGAGHYANGEEYRIWLLAKCYEIETRIGETQIANYPPGTKKEFTEADRNVIYSKFKAIFDSLKIDQTGENIVLPDSEN